MTVDIRAENGDWVVYVDNIEVERSAMWLTDPLEQRGDLYRFWDEYTSRNPFGPEAEVDARSFRHGGHTYHVFRVLDNDETVGFTIVGTGNIWREGCYFALEDVANESLDSLAALLIGLYSQAELEDRGIFE